MAALPPSVEFSQFGTLTAQMEQLVQQKKTTKAQLDQLEAHCINVLLQMNVRYVDAGGSGNGPYYVLSKHKSDGTWNRDRYAEFFNELLSEIAKGKQISPPQCTEGAVQYLKQFEKRKLQLIPRKQAPAQKGVDDLKAWLAGQGD